MDILEELTGGLHSDGLTGELKYSKYYRRISEIQERIHAQIPVVEYSTVDVASTAFDREEVYDGINYKKVVIFLMSNGCEWALKNGNGCTMCGHLAKQTRCDIIIPAENHIHQFESVFKKVDFKKYPLLNLFNNGSFLNDNEIAPQARTEILKMINSNPDIKKLVIESRPEFVTEDKISEIKHLLPGKCVEVAIGLELKDDRYRLFCLNKGFSLKDFDNAAEIITKHLNLRSYVFLKPIFLTEKEGIDQVVDTIEHAFTMGSSTVSLEACTVQDFTLTKLLYEQDLYTPPWLWSIVEAIKLSNRAITLNKHQQLIVGLFQFYPSPGNIPYNCPKCSDTIVEALRRYNRTLDPTIFDSLDCTCKREWEKVLNEKSQPFEKRMETLIRQLKI